MTLSGMMMDADTDTEKATDGKSLESRGAEGKAGGAASALYACNLCLGSGEDANPHAPGHGGRPNEVAGVSTPKREPQHRHGPAVICCQPASGACCM
jgi:hypothetical protein